MGENTGNIDKGEHVFMEEHYKISKYLELKLNKLITVHSIEVFSCS